MVPFEPYLMGTGSEHGSDGLGDNFLVTFDHQTAPFVLSSSASFVFGFWVEIGIRCHGL